jgi:calcium channel MID1
MIPGFNDSAAFTRSRNPLIDEVIQPGPYKEMKPCEDMCFDIVRSCPAQMGFSCPNGAQRESMYGRRDPDNDRLTCNFPGAVVKLNANSSGEALGVQMRGVVAVVGIVAAMLLV